jgi:polyribonucleotide nucleotidyltransferase
MSMQSISVSREIAGRTLSIETGTYAKLATGSVTVRYGDTIVFGAVCRANPREGIDFFPLQVEYRERRAAAGKFPGGFMKREGRPTNREILIARLIDRPLRPLFPMGFIDEVQIQLGVLSFDTENDTDVLAGIAASAAIHISDIPFTSPTAHAKVGKIDGKLVLFPTVQQLEESEFELVVAGTKQFVNMIELQGMEIPEEEVAEAIEFGHKAIIEIVGMIDELRTKADAPAKVGNITTPEAGFLDAIRARVADKIRDAKGKPGKADRNAAVVAILKELLAEYAAPITDPSAGYVAYQAQQANHKKIKAAFSLIEEQVTRELIVAGTRPDGRGPEDIRPIHCAVGVLPRVHGSSVFQRGETQAMCTIVLGTPSDEQLVDGLLDEYSQKFMLHYNFPNFSVGEVRPIRGLSRREVGHGNLAERSLLAVLPDVETFPYTVKVISDILESNGSSSMASSCGGCLALMDAGVPITRMVAGISVGLVSEGGKSVLITDILGEEDHFGDMDFKVCGTTEGITAIQLDIKIEGLDHKTIRDTLQRAKGARLKILKNMSSVLDKPRPTISDYAPRMLTIKIDPEKIGKVIGPGGKVIKKIQEDTGAKLDIEDDGTVYISSLVGGAAEKARDIVEAMTASITPGRIYNGRVVAVKEFGAFVEIAPEVDGMCHVSELSDGYIARVDDVVKVGDEMPVKVILIDDTGRIKLSRKQALKELGQEDTMKTSPREGGDAPRGDRPPRRDGPGSGDRRGGDASGGPRRDDRGPRRDGGGGGDRGPRRDGPAPRRDAPRSDDAPRGDD